MNTTFKPKFAGHKALLKAIDPFYTEAEAKKVIGGTRQNWSGRRTQLRRASGVQVKDLWFYRKKEVHEFIEARKKYSPVKS